MTDDTIEILKCESCGSHNLTGRGDGYDDGDVVMRWTCDKCDATFETVDVLADDNSLAARRLKKRPWLLRPWRR